MTKQQPMRFAIYARFSSDMQNEISLEAQERLCREAVAQRGGVVVSVYADDAETGWSLDRPGFVSLSKAAQKDKFDAIIFWKFDRLARDHNHVVMIKMLLRREYKLKLYCVQGFSEDEDDSPYTALMEQLLAIIYAFYSNNLSSETKRGKMQRAINGEFNGSRAPLGYTLITKAQATTKRPAGLYVEPRIAAIVRRAFKMYATRQFSDRMIAEWLNKRPPIQKLRAGSKPIGTDMVRDMLKNRTYTGMVKYAETFYTENLGHGKQSGRGRGTWYEGKHPGIISIALFEACQAARERAAAHHRPFAKVNTYMLNDRVYCARCTVRRPDFNRFDTHGKMRAHSPKRDTGNYICKSRDRGYGPCEQCGIPIEAVDAQVFDALSQLEVPQDYLARIDERLQQLPDHDELEKKHAAITDEIERVDFRWDTGYIERDDYMEKRTNLQKQLESLRPLEYYDLLEAADLLNNFAVYWGKCAALDNPNEGRQQLLSKIVERVFVYDQQVVGIALHGDYGVILDKEVDLPMDMSRALRHIIEKGEDLSAFTQFGSDGI